MKKLVWLLLMINVGLLTYFNLDRILPSAPQAKHAEIDPEKISVLSQKEIEVLPKKVVGASPALTPTATIATAASCYEWGVFSAANLTGAQSAADKLSLHGTVKEQTSQQAKRFWIYNPPFKTSQEAQVKAAELNALGIEDIFVVQEAKWKNAISFGTFEDESLALKLMSELKAKGVKNVAKALRYQGEGHSSLIFNNLAEAEAARLRELKPDFPEANLKEITCH